MRRRSQGKAGVWSDQRWIVSESGPGQFQGVGGVPDQWIDLGFDWWSWRLRVRRLRGRRWYLEDVYDFKEGPAPRHGRMLSQVNHLLIARRVYATLAVSLALAGVSEGFPKGRHIDAANFGVGAPGFAWCGSRCQRCRHRGRRWHC